MPVVPPVMSARVPGNRPLLFVCSIWPPRFLGHRVRPGTAPTCGRYQRRRTLAAARLATADPSAAPVIDPAYLSDPDDAELLLDGMELIREAMAGELIAAETSLELSPLA